MNEEAENLLSNEQISEILYKNTPCKGCIYFFFRLFIYILILIGFGDILASVLVYTITKAVDWYNGGYALLGIFIIFLASFSYKTRESPSGTCCYLLMIFISFLSQLGLTLGILLYSSYPSLIGQLNAETVRYSMLSISILIFLAFLIGCFYYCVLSKEFKKREIYHIIYGHPPDDFQPIVGVDLWRKYERTMIRWNRLFRA